MTLPKKNFKGQLDDEVVVCVFRKHWIAVFSSLISIPVLLFLIFLTFHYLPALMAGEHWLGWLMIVLLVTLHAAIHRQFIHIFNYYLKTVVLTDRRIVLVDKTVFFKDVKTSIDILNIQDIQKTRLGLLQTLLNYGSLHFMLSGSTSVDTIDLVPRPEYQYKKINEVKLELQAKHMVT